jgi:hypothetical protein
MKTTASSSASPASTKAYSSASEIADSPLLSVPTARHHHPHETKPSLPPARTRSRINGSGSHPSQDHGSAPEREIAIPPAAFTGLDDPAFSDSGFVRSSLSADLRAGIALCRRARLVLQGAAVRSLDAGGMELDPVHLRLLLDCAQICETAADFMSRNSPYHLYLCEVCAAICEACAESCALAGAMKECAAVCQECVVVCRAIAG